MTHLLDRTDIDSTDIDSTDIARIKIQAAFEDIYSKTNKCIQTATVHGNKIQLTTLLTALRDELKKLCDDYCTESEEKFRDIDRLKIEEEMCVKVIGNLKKNNSKLYQHLTIKLHHAIDSTELINNIRGVINATIAQINYIIAQKSYIIALKSYITAQNRYINAKNNKISAQNKNIIDNNKTIDNCNKIIANNTNAIAQNKNTIAKNSNTIAEDEFSLVLTDTPEDTCTSFVYTLKCSVCRNYYVGRTHYGRARMLQQSYYK